MDGVTAPADVALRRAEAAENFPVALRVLPRALRQDLRAVYDVVRTIDELGDTAAGDREAQLEAFAAELARLWLGQVPAPPVLRALAPAVERRGLPEAPFQDLVRANVQDQRVLRYRTRADLIGYCDLSAAPIGRLVLAVFGATGRDPAERERRVRLSDRVCNALQLLEHWQDVAEDRRAGRVYLPQEDLRRFGVDEADLDAATATPALRALVQAETDRAAALLDSGIPLVGELRGWARLAVAGYAGGGRATVDALRRSGGDVLAATPRPRRVDVLRHAVRLWVRP
jgi:squalene synthase HpnC